MIFLFSKKKLKKESHIERETVLSKYVRNIWILSLCHQNGKTSSLLLQKICFKVMAETLYPLTVLTGAQESLAGSSHCAEFNLRHQTLGMNLTII